MDTLSNNKMYIKHLEMSQNMNSIETATGRLYNVRRNTINKWENELTNILTGSLPIFCIDTYINYNQKKQNKWTWIIFRNMARKRINNNFSIHLIQNTIFAYYAKSSIRTPSQDWFKWVYKMNFVEQTKFNLLCQQLMSHIYILYEYTIFYSKKCFKGLFWVNIIHFVMNNNSFNEIISSILPAIRREKHCVILLIYSLSSIFWKIWRMFLKY